MENIFVTFSLAFVLGFAIAKGMAWAFPRARGWRVAVIVLAPVLALLASFLAFFEGAPVAEDWIWFTIGIGYFWPWYLAWGLGAAAEKLQRKAFAPSAA